jgi:hypothetical protein
MTRSKPVRPKAPHGFDAKDRSGAPKTPHGQNPAKAALLARMKAAAAAKAAKE